MSAFSISTLRLLAFLFFHFNLISANPYSSFSFKSFDKDSNFESILALYGDAQVVSDGSLLKLTSTLSPSHGGVVYKNPIKVVEGNPGNLGSFSSYLSFYMTPDGGDKLGFVMVPGFVYSRVFDDVSSFGDLLDSELGEIRSNVVFVEFEILRDGSEEANLSKIHVSVNVSGFESVKQEKNVSDASVAFVSAKRLHSWIDYEAGSRRLEVRLSQFVDSKPVGPLISYPIDLLKLWSDEKVFIGLSSSSQNSSQSCSVYSWSFNLRHFPHWLHSQPLDPHAVAKTAEIVVVEKKGDCVLRVIAALLIGTACGAFGACGVLYLWTIFSNKRPVVPVECSMDTKDFKYKEVGKVKVVDEVHQDGKTLEV